MNAWSDVLLDWQRGATDLTSEDFDFGCALAELVVSLTITPEFARGLIALHCAPLMRMPPHTYWLATCHHHGLPRSRDRARAAHRLATDELCELLRLAIPLARAERVAAEQRFRKAASGALLRRLGIADVTLAGSEAADHALTSARVEELVAEEAAWWMRRRAVAE